MSLAVVGGQGWLGRAIVRAAADHGVPVVVVSRRPSRDPGVIAFDPDVPATLARALDGVEVVVNAAGYRGADADQARGANFTMPDRLGRLAFEQGWRLIHIGSAAEYGHPEPLRRASAGPERPSAHGAMGGQLVEPDSRVAEDHFCAPPTLYGLTKLAGTRAILHWRDAGAAATVARVFNIAAADLPSDSPLHDITSQVRLVAMNPTMHGEVRIGDPTTVRDISRRSWIATAVLALAIGPHGVDHPVVNVCSGEGVRFGDLALGMARHLGVGVTVRDLAWPRGGRVVGDPTLLRSLLGVPFFEPDGTTADRRLDDLVRSILGPQPELVTSPGEKPCPLY